MQTNSESPAPWDKPTRWPRTTADDVRENANRCSPSVLPDTNGIPPLVDRFSDLEHHHQVVNGRSGAGLFAADVSSLWSAGLHVHP
jgi:hypothetical protein